MTAALNRISPGVLHRRHSHGGDSERASRDPKADDGAPAGLAGRIEGEQQQWHQADRERGGRGQEHRLAAQRHRHHRQRPKRPPAPPRQGQSHAGDDQDLGCQRS